MSETGMISRTTEPGTYLLWCPGCDEAHQVGVPPWTFNGDFDRPTISPSIKVTGRQWAKGAGFYKPRHLVAQGEPTVCHSFVRDGRWEYLADCTHVLAGQTVDGVPFSSAVGGDPR